MRLSHKTTVKLNSSESNILGHMCYAAFKLWNVCNYERRHYKELSLPVEYPNWYYQKKTHKGDLWYKQLPAQTAQEVCKLLDQAWKSFYALLKSPDIENPRPPRFKQSPIAITYMQYGIVHETGSDTVKLSLLKQLVCYMSQTYGISAKFLFLKNPLFKNTDRIKQIKIYPPENGECDIIIVYDVDDIPLLPDNGRYLSVDIGLHNLLTCYESSTGNTFILGRKYLSLCHYYDKKIARVQSQWGLAQARSGVKYPKSSKHIRKIYANKKNAVNDYLHKVTRYLAEYCKMNHINTVVIGDITGIRKGKNLGHVNNQKLHSLPFRQIYLMLGYKLALYGIRFILQKESYSSQVSPLKAAVSKKNACKGNRKKRGLYCDNGYSWNADCVGAFNILRLYLTDAGSAINLNALGIKHPHIVKVAV